MNTSSVEAWVCTYDNIWTFNTRIDTWKALMYKFFDMGDDTNMNTPWKFGAYITSIWTSLIWMKDNFLLMVFNDGCIGQSEPATTNALVGRSVHWMGCIFHSAPNGVHHSPFLFATNHCAFLFLGSWPFSLWTWFT